jgi:hypothetical protein
VVLRVTKSIQRLITGFLLSIFLLKGMIAESTAAQPDAVAPPRAELRAEEAGVGQPHGEQVAKLNPGAFLNAGQGSLTGVTQQSTQPGQPSEHEIMRQLLVILAYQKDPQLRKLIKKRNYSSPMLSAVGLGIYGVSFAQSVYALRHIYDEHLLFPKGYRQIKTRLRTAANMTVIYYGILFGGIAIIASWNIYFDRKIKKRKKEIDAQIDGVIRYLSAGANHLYARSELVDLLKSEEVIMEYLNLWYATHPRTVEDAPLPESRLKLQRFK